MTGAKSTHRELRARRRDRRHGCWDHLIIAPLWVAYDANLGTLMRTCDAIGACLAVPRTEHYGTALAKGDTLRSRRPCIHWLTTSKPAWCAQQQEAGKRLVAVELAEGATALSRLPPARGSTVVLLGHEHHGIPDDILARVDECVEIGDDRPGRQPQRRGGRESGGLPPGRTGLTDAVGESVARTAESPGRW